MVNPGNAVFYVYCLVVPEGMKQSFYYIAEEPVAKGNTVLIDFPGLSQPLRGEVIDLKVLPEKDCPTSPEDTRRILCVLDSSESELEFDELAQKEAEVDDYLVNEDFDSVIEWCRQVQEDQAIPLAEKVVECYQACINNGNFEAATDLGSMYYTGCMVKQNYKKAVEYYSLAAEHQEQGGLCNLGYCYFYGRSVKIDYAKAYECWNQAVLLYDDVNSLYKIGDLYQQGKYFPQNDELAFKMYNRAYELASAADVESVAFTCLGDIHVRLADSFLHNTSVVHDSTLALIHATEAIKSLYIRKIIDPLVDPVIERAKRLLNESMELLDHPQGIVKK